MPDAFKNHALTTVTTAPSPAASGTSLAVADASVFPLPPFTATVWPAAAAADASNSEFVRVTAITGNTLTIVRTTEAPGAARTIVAGDQIGQTLTAAALDQLATVTPIPATVPTLARIQASLAKRDLGPVKLVFLGSSTTGGANASEVGKRYVNRLVRMIQQSRPLYNGLAQADTVMLAAANVPTEPGIYGYNGGVGGTTAADYLDSTRLSKITDLQPQVIFHMIGSNDFKNGVTPATYKANVQAAMSSIDSAVTGPHVHVLIHAYERWDAGKVGSYTWAEFRAALQSIADARPADTWLIDLNPAYVNVGIPNVDPLDLIDTDNVHQNDSGHAFMADLLRDYLQVDGVKPSASTGGGGGAGANAGVPVGWYLTQPYFTAVGNGTHTSGRAYLSWVDVPVLSTWDLVAHRVATAAVGGTPSFEHRLYPIGADGLADLSAAPLAAVTPSLTATGNQTVSIASLTLPTGRYWWVSFYYAPSAPSTAPQLTSFNGNISNMGLPTSQLLGTVVRGYMIRSLTAFPTSLAGLEVTGSAEVPVVGLRRAA